MSIFLACALAVVGLAGILPSLPRTQKNARSGLPAYSSNSTHGHCTRGKPLWVYKLLSGNWGADRVHCLGRSLWRKSSSGNFAKPYRPP